MKKRGRPRILNPLSGRERSRRWRERERERDRESLANIVAAVEKGNEKDIILTTAEEIWDFIYQRKPGEY